MTQPEPELFEAELAVLLALAMEIVRDGGKLTLVGGPCRPEPLAPGGGNAPRRRYEGTLCSPSAGRIASATGETLAGMLAALMRRWGNL